MSLYLPIAEMSVSVVLMLGMGASVGFLSGLFGVGGGFLLTPLLMFAGIPTAVAVGTAPAQVVASSVSGALTQWRRGNVDIKLGIVLLVGGVVGSFIGVHLVTVLRRTGQFDVFVSLTYVTLLGVVGLLMLIESLRTMRATKAGGSGSLRRSGQHNWSHGLPFKMRFHRSKLYISVLPPLVLGAFVGLLAAIMGVGGGFLIVPAMIYMLHVPTGIVVGTSQFQIIFVTAMTTILHAADNRSVDVVLALLLMAGGVIGAEVGSRAGEKLKGEQLRFLLALLVLAVCARVGWDLVTTPADFFSIQPAVS
jgi:uncharacterized protein